MAKVTVKNETKTVCAIAHSDCTETKISAGESVAVELTEAQAKALNACSDLTFDLSVFDEDSEPVEIDKDLLKAAIDDGFKVDGRWSDERIAEELEKFLSESE